MFVPTLHYVCTMFAPCLYYVLMSFDVKIGKIAKEGNRQQALGTSGEKSEIRNRRSGGRSQQLEVRSQISEDRGRGAGVRRKEGGPLGGGKG